MRITSVFIHVLPMLACVLAPVAAQSNSTSIFDRLRSSWSSAVGSLKSAVDILWSSLSSAFDSLKNALDDLRTSIADVIKPSKDAYEEKGHDMLSSSLITSTPATATEKPVAFPTKSFIGTPSTPQSATHVGSTTATPTGYAAKDVSIPGEKHASSPIAAFGGMLTDGPRPAPLGPTGVPTAPDESTVTPPSAPSDNTTASTTEKTSMGRLLIKILRILLGAGMLACVGLFCCREKSLICVILFLLFLCILLLLSPGTSTVDDEPASILTSWDTLAALASLVIVSCCSGCLCVKDAPFFVAFYLAVLDILLLFWRSFTLFGWLYWLIGFIVVGVCVGILVIVGFLIFDCDRVDKMTSRPRPALSRWELDSYSYRSPSPDPYYNLRYAYATTRPRTPSDAAPAPLALPLLDATHDVELGRVTEQYEIEEGSTGHTYGEIFARHINASLTSVAIEEPWLHARYQFAQLKDFLKAFVERAINLRCVSVLTQRATDDNEAEQARRRARQEQGLIEIRRWLKLQGVGFRWNYVELHDRWIRLDNGWNVTIGRGLSFYHPSSGASDRDFAVRRCRKTTVTFVPV